MLADINIQLLRFLRWVWTYINYYYGFNSITDLSFLVSLLHLLPQCFTCSSNRPSTTMLFLYYSMTCISTECRLLSSIKVRWWCQLNDYIQAILVSMLQPLVQQSTSTGIILFVCNLLLSISVFEMSLLSLLPWMSRCAICMRIAVHFALLYELS